MVFPLALDQALVLLVEFVFIFVAFTLKIPLFIVVGGMAMLLYGLTFSTTWILISIMLVGMFFMIVGSIMVIEQ